MRNRLNWQCPLWKAEAQFPSNPRLWLSPKEVNECPARSVKANNTSPSFHLSCEEQDQPFVRVQRHHLTFILANTGNHQNSVCKHVTLQSRLICA